MLHRQSTAKNHFGENNAGQRCNISMKCFYQHADCAVACNTVIPCSSSKHRTQAGFYISVAYALLNIVLCLCKLSFFKLMLNNFKRYTSSELCHVFFYTKRGLVWGLILLLIVTKLNSKYLHVLWIHFTILTNIL